MRIAVWHAQCSAPHAHSLAIAPHASLNISLPIIPAWLIAHHCPTVTPARSSAPIHIALLALKAMRLAQVPVLLSAAMDSSLALSSAMIIIPMMVMDARLHALLNHTSPAILLMAPVQHAF